MSGLGMGRNEDLKCLIHFRYLFRFCPFPLVLRWGFKERKKIEIVISPCSSHFLSWGDGDGGVKWQSIIAASSSSPFYIYAGSNISMSTFFQPRWWMRSRLSQHFYDSATSDSLTISSSPSPLLLVVFTPFGRIWWLDAHSTYWSVPRVIFPYTFRLLFWISHSRVSWFLSYVFLSKSSFERRVKKKLPPMSWIS